MPIYVEKYGDLVGCHHSGTTNKQTTNKERQSYSANRPWRAEMSNKIPSSQQTYLLESLSVFACEVNKIPILSFWRTLALGCLCLFYYRAAPPAVRTHFRIEVMASNWRICLLGSGSLCTFHLAFSNRGQMACFRRATKCASTECILGPNHRRSHTKNGAECKSN